MRKTVPCAQPFSSSVIKAAVSMHKSAVMVKLTVLITPMSGTVNVGF